MLLRSLGDEATLAVISLISNSILQDFDTEDLAVAFAAFALYYLVRVAGLDSGFKGPGVVTVLARAWELFGSVIVGIITQYIIRQAQDAIGSRSLDGQAVVLGFSLVIVALVVEEFGLLAQPRFVGIVTFSLGIYYSALLLSDLETSRGYITDPVVVATLFASYAWLHFYRQLHAVVFANENHPYVERVFEVVTRTAKFVLVRWVVNIYETVVFDEMYHLILWFPHLGGIAVVAAFIEGFDPEDAVTVKACLEAFALFLSSVFFERYSQRFLPDAIFALLAVIIWYILRSILRLPIMSASKGFWWRWLDYTLGVTARIASYLAIQAILPQATSAIGHATNTVERLALYFLVILVASALLWNGL